MKAIYYNFRAFSAVFYKFTHITQNGKIYGKNKLGLETDIQSTRRMPRLLLQKTIKSKSQSADTKLLILLSPSKKKLREGK